MLKKAVIGASALMIAGSMMVYAQQRGDGPGEYRGPGHMGMMGGWRPSADDIKAFSDARIAALHAGLELNSDQEKNWPPVEQALRDLAKQRAERLAARRDSQSPAGTPIERLQRRADDLTARGTALKHLADAASPLYQSLDDAQKHRLMMLASLLRRHGGHRGMWSQRFGRDGDGDRFDYHHFGDQRGMGGPRGMGRTHGDDDEDYRGPL